MLQSKLFARSAAILTTSLLNYQATPFTLICRSYHLRSNLVRSTFTAATATIIMDIEKEVLRAEQRIRPYVRETPLEHSLWFSHHMGATVFFKLENLQVTGSFKFRGALNKLCSLFAAERAKGCVTSSSGNHGAAFCHALQQIPGNVKGTVFLPENISLTKLSKIQLYQDAALESSSSSSLSIQQYGTDVADTENAGRAYAEQNNLTYIPPYNDPQIIGGQGTIGVELYRQSSDNPLDAVFVAIGGGGLISGIGSYLKSVWPDVEIVGCSPANSAVMKESIDAGKILVDMESLPTLSDGTAGGLEPDTITFGICQEVVDTHILVSEEEIASALKAFMEKHHMMVEGAAAVALAGLLQKAEMYKGKRVAVIMCGSNIPLDKLKSIL